MSDLNDKVVIITGAVGNVGRATADAVLARGARAVLIDRSQDRLEPAFKGAAPAESLLLRGDVDLTDEASVEAMVRAALDRFGRIDGLVNTVGGFRGGKGVDEEDLATWDLMMTMNVRTALLACRAALPTMLGQGGGSIVTISAGAALAGPAGLAAYSASKAALLKLTESLANEVKTRGIRVNAVLPGTIDTPQNRKAMPDADTTKWVTTGDLAAVIAFLLSDGARAVTGAALPVFGKG